VSLASSASIRMSPKLLKKCADTDDLSDRIGDVGDGQRR
jgi:hypothetical protein